MECFGCGKKPMELLEYRDMAEMRDCAPDEIVIQEEETYDWETNFFVCTECYIEMGMPSIHQLKCAFDEKNRGAKSHG